MAGYAREAVALVRKVGNLQFPETSPPRRPLPMIGLIRELRLAERSLRRDPVFSVAAVATLALGIGATTAVFSVLYGVLLSPLP